MASDSFEALSELVRQRQRERGFPIEFKKGDLVRFPLGERGNQERDYRITMIYNNGFEVECDGFTYVHTDEAAIRLGMTHSPNNGTRS